MCLAIPGRIVEIREDEAVIDYGGVQKNASIRLCPEAAVGACALVHAGFVIQLMDEDSARELEELLSETQELS
jgi:hydrogenase expression/formation protein HypC